MAGRSIENSGNEFGKIPPHPGQPLKRYIREVQTPTGIRTITIVDVNNHINPNPNNLKKLGLTPSDKKA